MAGEPQPLDRLERRKTIVIPKDPSRMLASVRPLRAEATQDTARHVMVRSDTERSAIRDTFWQETVEEIRARNILCSTHSQAGESESGEGGTKTRKDQPRTSIAGSSRRWQILC